MRISVTHTSTYLYGDPVQLEPHVVRLRPRSDGAQRLCRFELSIDPPPAGRTECLDQDGNVVTQAWFEGTTERFSVSSCFEVELLRENPYDFLLPVERVLEVPFVYAEPWGTLLAPYTNCSNRVGIAPGVQTFARELATESGERVLPFVAILNERLFEEWKPILRPDGEPFPAEKTLAAREGSCRDLAVLFCEACRTVGLASRFVSGYERAAATSQHPYLHAWAEVYLPGGGWRGFDPSRGAAVAKDHVAVAAARHSPLAAPLTGSYRGNPATGLEVQISMQVQS